MHFDTPTTGDGSKVLLGMVSCDGVPGEPEAMRFVLTIGQCPDGDAVVRLLPAEAGATPLQWKNYSIWRWEGQQRPYAAPGIALATRPTDKRQKATRCHHQRTSEGRRCNGT
jgi:hypothetical protein